jgi:hypothetical protein
VAAEVSERTLTRSRIRPQPSGAAGRQRAKERAAKALAEGGQLELKLVVRVEALDVLVASGDISEDDLLTPAKASEAVAELLADMARALAALHMEEPQREPATLYRVVLPGSGLSAMRRGSAQLIGLSF